MGRLLFGILFLLSIQAQGLNAETCTSLFTKNNHQLLDPRYGKLSQHEERLDLFGLFSPDGTSMMCGPVCAYNVLYKWLGPRDPSYSYAEAARRVYDFVYQDLLEMRLNPNSVRKWGIDPPQMSFLIEKVFSEKQIHASVTIKSANSYSSAFHSFQKEGLDLRDLRASIEDGKATILLIGKYGNSLLKEGSPFQQPVLRERMGGHYLVVRGYDRHNPFRFYILDPRDPSSNTSVLLEPMQPEHFSPTYRVHYEDRFSKGNIYILDQLLLVE